MRKVQVRFIGVFPQGFLVRRFRTRFAAAIWCWDRNKLLKMRRFYYGTDAYWRKYDDLLRKADNA